MNKKKVIVAMSGGVDSSVAAALLKRGGFDVVGVFMKCWSEGANCTSTEDEKMARLAAIKIGIPFYSFDLQKEYKEKIVEYMLNGYEKGITPNPDVMCNKEIKFGLFFEKAMEMGADFVATGHYARIRCLQNTPYASHAKPTASPELRSRSILQARDKNKDQSYFLSMIDSKVLSKVLFPVGKYTKPEVRALARKFGLPTAERPDSQGLCFVGKVDFTNFLKQYLPEKEGEIVDIQGKILGTHPGTWFYTIGQRKGIGLSGGPYYVVQKDTAKNQLVVSKDEKDLYQKELEMTNCNWFSQDVPEKVSAQIRYRQTPVSCKVVKEGDGFRLIFQTPQRAPAPGQMAVLYKGSEMLGGGIIQ